MKKILIVIADYYKDISVGLLKSAVNYLPKNFDIKTIKVPGVFEIPVTISKNLKKYHAFIALGCVIKGQTLILILFQRVQLMQLCLCL